MRLKKAIKILNELNCRRKKKTQYLDPVKYNIEKLKLITKAIDTILNKVQNKNKWGEKVYQEEERCQLCKYYSYDSDMMPCKKCLEDYDNGIGYYYKNKN